MAKKPKLRLVKGGRERGNSRGPKRWAPTPLERRTVERCMAIGFTVEQAASVLGKSARSVARYCADEIEHGAARVNAKIGGTLLRKALAGDTVALIFVAKCRLGWNERQLVEHTGRDGGPIVYEGLEADADAFTRRVFDLGARHLAAVKAREAAAEPIALAPPAEAPAPTEIN